MRPAIRRLSVLLTEGRLLLHSNTRKEPFIDRAHWRAQLLGHKADRGGKRSLPSSFLSLEPDAQLGVNLVLGPLNTCLPRASRPTGLGHCISAQYVLL
jgi:hypothetical protein